jgi:hypothetical protein
MTWLIEVVAIGFPLWLMFPLLYLSITGEGQIDPFFLDRVSQCNTGWAL